VWMDDFESPSLRWGVNSSAGSPDPVLSTTRAWMGAQSVWIHIVAGAGEFSLMQRQFPLLRLGRVGVEFFIFMAQFLSAYMALRVNLYDGTNISQAELRLDSIARTATIVTPAGNIVVATNAFNTVFNQTWVPFKLVIDMDTDRYVRLLLGPDEIDLSDHELVAGGGTTDRMIDITFNVESPAGNAASVWLDNFILTQNEP